MQEGRGKQSDLSGSVTHKYTHGHTYLTSLSLSPSSLSAVSLSLSAVSLSPSSLFAVALSQPLSLCCRSLSAPPLSQPLSLSAPPLSLLSLSLSPSSLSAVALSQPLLSLCCRSLSLSAPPLSLCCRSLSAPPLSLLSLSLSPSTPHPLPFAAGPPKVWGLVGDERGDGKDAQGI